MSVQQIQADLRRLADDVASGRYGTDEDFDYAAFNDDLHDISRETD